MPTNIYSIKDVLLTQEKGPAKDHVSARYKTPAMFSIGCSELQFTVAARITQPDLSKNDSFQLDLNARGPFLYLSEKLAIDPLYKVQTRAV
jgi:hypothetical protein